MTVSIRFFEEKSDQDDLIAYWNTDGTLRILYRRDKNDEGTSALMIPSILREIVTADVKGDGVILDTGEINLPGMFQYSGGRIVAEAVGKKIRITGYREKAVRTTKGKLVTITRELVKSPSFELSRSRLKAILNGCVDAIADFKAKCGIQPVFGPVLRKDKTKKVR